VPNEINEINWAILKIWVYVQTTAQNNEYWLIERVSLNEPHYMSYIPYTKRMAYSESLKKYDSSPYQNKLQVRYLRQQLNLDLKGQ
jgi:hypothetical protein